MDRIGYRELIRILSPLLFYSFHVFYLIVWSTDPFLKKWLEGSFTFFLALVLCNIIRSRVVAAKSQDGVSDKDGHGPDGPPDGDPRT
jgi:hypothetical protein